MAVYSRRCLTIFQPSSPSGILPASLRPDNKWKSQNPTLLRRHSIWHNGTLWLTLKCAMACRYASLSSNFSQTFTGSQLSFSTAVPQRRGRFLAFAQFEDDRYLIVLGTEPGTRFNTRRVPGYLNTRKSEHYYLNCSSTFVGFCNKISHTVTGHFFRCPGGNSRTICKAFNLSSSLKRVIKRLSFCCKTRHVSYAKW